MRSPFLPEIFAQSSGFVVFGRSSCAWYILVRTLTRHPLDAASWPEDRRVDEILAVRSADHDDVLETLAAVDLGEQLRDDRALDVRGDPGPARPEQRVHLVEENDDGN